MPYIHAVVAQGFLAARKRALIRAITASTVRVLEVPPADVHVFLWEISPENLGFGGDEPCQDRVNNYTVVFRQGRHPEVRLTLIERLTDAIQSELQVAREHIHIILSEIPPEDVGEGGVAMGPPPQPSWHISRHSEALPTFGAEDIEVTPANSTASE